MTDVTVLVPPESGRQLDGLESGTCQLSPAHTSFPTADDVQALGQILGGRVAPTPGAAASDLGWGNTRAWQAEAELQAAGAIQHDPIGRMVPTQRHREALLLPDTFHERNIQ